MNTIFKILFLVSILFLQACEECGECFTPPEHFTFNLVDKSTGENMFTKGAYNAEDIEVIDMADGSEVEFIFTGENDLNLIIINTIGWKTEKVTYSINIASENILTLYVDAERISEDCCEFTRFHEVKVENCEYEKSPGSEYYIVLEE